MSAEAEKTIGTTFEDILVSDKFKLFPTPNSVVKAEVGEEIKLPRGFYGYQVIGYAVEDEWLVDLTHNQKPTKGIYKILYKGPVAEIRYRNPKDNQKYVGKSAEINFSILEKISGISHYLRYYAFYIP